MDYPKISIVTPSFNQAEFLEQTICSVLSQNYPNLEYVVIDGGSTDGSVEIIKKYADKLTYWVSEKDKGQYDAINKGFSHTSGDIMGWVNSSDIYYPWTFTIIAEIFNSIDKVEWLTGMPTNLSSGTAPQSITYTRQRNMYDFIRGDYKWLQQESIFWRRNLWDKVGGKLDLNIKYAGDFNLWLEFFHYASLYYVNTILGGFRYHDIRRGNDINHTYEIESADLIKKFTSELPLNIKLKAALSNTFIRKLKILGWYRRYNIYYDYGTDKWLTQVW